ncbi:MAG: BCCT family transporter, partial [Pseudomonadales bacterium]|nr:BCCT family transporter [Pseudomonadales bacterium]
NIQVSIGLLLAVILLGPTDYLLRSLPANLWDYAVNVIPMGLWTADKQVNQDWQSAWTVFYWGWWLAWTPFVALFIARISRGRTVREFILGVLFVPAIIIVLWMTVFGGTALNQELQATGAVSEAVNADYSRGLVATIQNLTDSVMSPILLAVVSFLLFTWLVTSLDSATLVICHILRFDHLGSMKILWGFILGAVACTLLLIGGLPALQAASIIIGLPMAVILLLVLVSTVKIMFGK